MTTTPAAATGAALVIARAGAASISAAAVTATMRVRACIGSFGESSTDQQ
jgi:hypothetical protein